MSNNKKNKNIRTLKRTLNFKKYSIGLIWFMDKTNLLPIFSWFINRIMRIFKIKKQFNPHLNYHYYARIFRGAFNDMNTENPVILFPFIMGSESSYNVREMMIAKYMERKGYRSQFIYCNGIFDLCPKERIFKTRTSTPLFCKECCQNYNYISKNTGLPFDYLSSLATLFDNKEMNNEINKALNISTIDECKEYLLNDDIPIGKLAYKSVLRFYQKGELGNTTNELETYQKFIQSAIKTYYIFDSYFSKHSIHTVILWNGTSFFDCTISFVCKKRNIPYITQESFIGSNSWIYKRNDIAIYLNFYNDWKQKIANKPLIPEQHEKVLTLFNQFKTGESTIVHFNDSKKGLALDPNFEYVALFPSLNFDSYVLGRNPLFNSSNNWIIETIKYWNTNVKGIKLIIRAHPGEVKLLTATTHFLSEVVSPLLTEKIIFIDSDDDVSTYELMMQLKYTICYSSTIGVEAMLNGIPTVIAGESFYKPFAVVPKTKKEYFETIEQLNQSIQDVSIDKEQLLNYLHYLYFVRTKHIKGFDIDRKNGIIKVKDAPNYKVLLENNNDLMEEFYQETIFNQS